MKCPEADNRELVGPCLVWSCKNYCEGYDHNCLGIERHALKDSAVSVQELAFYRKQPVAEIERQAHADHLSVQAIVALDQFYSWVQQNAGTHRNAVRAGPAYNQWVTRYPMDSGMWALDIRVLAAMFDPEVWAEWLAATDGHQGPQAQFKHSAVLHCKLGEYRAIVREILPYIDLQNLSTS